MADRMLSDENTIALLGRRVFLCPKLASTRGPDHENEQHCISPPTADVPGR